MKRKLMKKEGEGGNELGGVGAPLVDCRSSLHYELPASHKLSVETHTWNVSTLGIGGRKIRSN